MVARTRIALLALVGVLAGTAPALANAQDPSPALAASTSVGASCTRCMAHVAMAAVPLYKEVVAATQWLVSLGHTSTPVMNAAKLLGGKVFEVSYKKSGTGDE